jgi:hypothetical protein
VLRGCHDIFLELPVILSFVILPKSGGDKRELLLIDSLYAFADVLLSLR